MGNEGVGVVSVAQGGSQLDQLSSACGTKHQRRLHALGPAQELPGDYEVEPAAYPGLAKDDLAGIQAEALGRLVEQKPDSRRALQQFRHGMRSNRFESPGSCLTLHSFISLYLHPDHGLAGD